MPHEYQFLLWLGLALIILAVIVRGFWLYRASLTWPTADGSITNLDIKKRNDTGVAGGHYFRATFTYEFSDPEGRHVSGTWHRNFSTETEAREFATRELPFGKAVTVRFSPKNPSLNSLELDSWAYTNDRPMALNI